ncbi:trehalase family glycosidase [Urechidicola croceus]|uniref:Trehalase n=1 Tax=Urechidicola croceus TaxID=1850246 RepID=A0A1D8PAJ7_9FLAO|nr:trehalase family glycosidase [Urechidicola croceus]AOW21551.1 trehalase [Urechidicola croceus]
MQFKVNIETNLQMLLLQEDTDGDKKITIEDKGPQKFELISTEGKSYLVNGTYHLSNLLQELVIAKNEGKTETIIPLSKIEEPPFDRISRMIRDYFWDGLTRTIDKEGIEKIVQDEKSESTEKIIYVPFGDTLAQKYFVKVANEIGNIKVEILPEIITPEYVLSINNKPGILSLALENRNGDIKGIPFVVPGGRFNEMYGWDSYFESIGLMIDGKTHLAKAMADNFDYQIQHYGKILNANRSYYLTRTQPPFFSSLIKEVFENSKEKNIDWLKERLNTAIKEYETVWMVDGKRLTENGLNRYYAEGIGMPPETEEGHFKSILSVFAKKHNLSLDEFETKYASREIIDKELDIYFIHDRSLRESGHDTSNRLEDKCASLNTVDLNSLLYKYETDFAEIISTYFDGTFISSKGKKYSSEYWLEKSGKRKELINKYLWNNEDGIYYDYNIETKKQEIFISATTFYPLWAKICSKEQAEKLVVNILPKLIEKGGVVSCTKESRGIVDENNPQRQWDYPYGWAPHQMLIWKGLLHYGYEKEVLDLIEKWLHMIAQNATDYNGTVPEKYDVVDATHKVFTEYGNVGTEFEYITQEGFGWMNASFQLGLYLLKD